MSFELVEAYLGSFKVTAHMDDQALDQDWKDNQPVVIQAKDQNAMNLSGQVQMRGCILSEKHKGCFTCCQFCILSTTKPPLSKSVCPLIASPNMKSIVSFLTLALLSTPILGAPLSVKKSAASTFSPDTDIAGPDDGLAWNKRFSPDADIAGPDDGLAWNRRFSPDTDVAGPDDGLAWNKRFNPDKDIAGPDDGLAWNKRFSPDTDIAGPDDGLAWNKRL